MYADAGIDLSKPVIGMCIGGMSSCTLVLTAHLCGCPDVALYHVRRIKSMPTKWEVPRQRGDGWEGSRGEGSGKRREGLCDNVSVDVLMDPSVA